MSGPVVHFNEDAQNPYQGGKIPGIETQIIFQNYGDGLLEPYGLVGMSNHRISRGANYRSAEDPDIHGAAVEVFECLWGHLTLLCMKDGQVEQHDLKAGVFVAVGHGIPHWFVAHAYSGLRTTLIKHRAYTGEVPWRSDATI